MEERAQAQSVALSQLQGEAPGGGGEELQEQKDFLEWILRGYAAGGVLDGLLDCVKEALRDILVYREFSVMYGEEPDGFLEVARTIPIYPSWMVAYLTCNPTNKSRSTRC